jgi:uncharacterized membrane protein
MQILKGMAWGLTGFFLFIILPVLGLVLSVNSTLLSAEFVEREVDKLDLSELIKEVITEQVNDDDFSYIPGIEATLTEIKPWINQATGQVIHSGYDYFLGKTEQIEIEIDTTTLQKSLTKNLTASYINTSADGLTELTVEEQNMIRDEFERQISEIIPSPLQLDQKLLGPDGITTLEYTRQAFSYLRIGLWALIALSIILALLIYLITRDKRETLLTLGIIFTLSGILNGIAYLTLRQLILNINFTGDLYIRIQTWVSQVAVDILSPWGIFSLCLFITGATLTIVFFNIRRRHLLPDSGSQAEIIS